MSLAACALLLATLTTPVAPAGTLFVLNKAEDSVTLIDLKTGQNRATLKTGPDPNEVIVSPNQKLVAITDMGRGPSRPGNTMTLVDVAQGKVSKTIDLSPHGTAHGIVWLSDTRLIFTSHNTDTLNELDIESGKIIRTIPTEQKGTHLAVVTKDQKRAFAVNAFSGSVTAIDLNSGTILKQIPTGNRAEGISLSPDGKWLACGNVGGNSVSIIDTSKLEVVHTIAEVQAPIRTMFTADGKHLLASSIQVGLRVFEVGSWAPKHTIQMTAPESGVKSGDSTPVAPMNLWQSRNGMIYNVLVAHNRVVEIDPANWKVTRGFPTGQVPDGICVAEG